jgi:hypothetical protein
VTAAQARARIFAASLKLIDGEVNAGPILTRGSMVLLMECLLFLASKA